MFCLSQRSRRVLQLALGGISTPEGRIILPEVFRLHLPARTYLSTSLHILIRCPALPQNLQQGFFFARAPGTVAWVLTAFGLALVARRLDLSSAIARMSAALLEVTMSADADRGITCACRNTSAVPGGVRMGGYTSNATGECFMLRRKGDLSGAWCWNDCALLERAEVCWAGRNGCGSGGNR